MRDEARELMDEKTRKPFEKFYTTLGTAILKDKKVIPTEDMEEWGRNMQHWNTRRVKVSEVGPYSLSTVFLGMDHGFGGPPLWFETCLFSSDMSEVVERYATYQEAEEGHERALERLLNYMATGKEIKSLKAPPES